MPVDPWATTTAQEFPTQEPDTFRRLAQIIAKQKREMFDLRASVLANVSDIVSDLRAQQATLAAQVATLAAQNAQILALIAQVVSPLTAHADTTGIALATGANVEKLRATITVPTGYTQALVTATSMISAWNTTAGRDELYAITSINGAVSGWSTETSVPAGSIGFAINTASALLTGLSGTFYVAAKGSTFANPWPSMTGYGLVNVDVMVVFLR